MIKRRAQWVVGLCLSSPLVMVADTPPQSRFQLDFFACQTAYLGGQAIHAFEQSIQHDYEALGIAAEIVQSMPMSPSFRLRLIKANPTKPSVGWSYSVSGTGGRLHYADYSGSMTLDYILRNQSLAVVVQSAPLNLGRFRVYQTNQVGVRKIDFLLSETIEVWDESLSDALEAEGLAYCVEPGLEVLLAAQGGIQFGIYLGVDLTLHGQDFHLPNNKDAVLQTNAGTLKADWAEFNLGVKIGGLTF